MRIRLSQIHIENLRSIRNASFAINPTTVLFGMNDSGKTNLLIALNLALGSRNITEKDVFYSNDAPYTKERSVVIDLKFVPVDIAGLRLDTFDDAWGLHLGSNISVDEQDKEYFAYRTKFSYDSDRDDYVRERFLISSWTDEEIIQNTTIGNKTLAAFEFVYLDAHRDISQDIRERSSIWSRQVSRLKISDEAKSSIEDSLVGLGQQIMAESTFLRQAELDLMTSTNTSDSKIEIHPVTRTIDEIYKGLDIYVTQNASAAISISQMGSGTRSRAAFSAVKTVINEKVQNATGTPYFCIIAFEEPEAHIHPQAQRKLIVDFAKIQGQRMITTHSPYILSATDASDLVYVSMEKAETRVSSLAEINFQDNDLFKIKRMVIDTHGEALFAKLVVITEGDTERLALPVFFKEYFGVEPYELGVTIAGIGGEGNYLPFMRVFEKINLPWMVFGDCEEKVETNIRKSVKELLGLSTEPDLELYPHIVLLDKPDNYENYLVRMGYAEEIVTAINEVGERPNEKALPFFEHFAKGKFGQPTAEKCGVCHSAIWVAENKSFCCEDGKKAAIVACMEKHKIKFALPIARQICKASLEERKYPQKIKLLLEQIKRQLEVQNEPVN